MVLEFDHVRGKKKYAISVILSGCLSMTTLKDEIDKCEIRCANCHRRITYIRGKGWKWMITQPDWAVEFWEDLTDEEWDD